MSDLEISRLHIGWDEDRKGWRYDFVIQEAGRQMQLPILISDACPEDQRPQAANEAFRTWVATVAEEAAKL